MECCKFLITFAPAKIKTKLKQDFHEKTVCLFRGMSICRIVLGTRREAAANAPR